MTCIQFSVSSCTGIGIGIGISQYYWVLGACFGIVQTLVSYLDLRDPTSKGRERKENGREKRECGRGEEAREGEKKERGREGINGMTKYITGLTGHSGLTGTIVYIPGQ